MKITDALRAEHVVFHNLFDHIERSAPKLRTLSQIRLLARLLEDLLKAHSDVEEELLIQPLEHCLEQLGQRDTFHQEHEEIDESVRRAQSTRSLQQARTALLGAVVASRKHFDKEERLVFPLAEKMLNARTLTQLWSTWTEQRNRTTPKIDRLHQPLA